MKDDASSCMLMEMWHSDLLYVVASSVKILLNFDGVCFVLGRRICSILDVFVEFGQ